MERWSVPEGGGSSPPDTALHFLELFSDDRCIATGVVVGFLLYTEQVLLRVVMIVRVDKFVDEFSSLFAYRVVGVGRNIGR